MPPVCPCRYEASFHHDHCISETSPPTRGRRRGGRHCKCLTNSQLHLSEYHVTPDGSESESEKTRAKSCVCVVDREHHVKAETEYDTLDVQTEPVFLSRSVSVENVKMPSYASRVANYLGSSLAGIRGAVRRVASVSYDEFKGVNSVSEMGARTASESALSRCPCYRIPRYHPDGGICGRAAPPKVKRRRKKKSCSCSRDRSAHVVGDEVWRSSSDEGCEDTAATPHSRRGSSNLTPKPKRKAPMESGLGTDFTSGMGTDITEDDLLASPRRGSFEKDVEDTNPSNVSESGLDELRLEKARREAARLLALGDARDQSPSGTASRDDEDQDDFDTSSARQELAEMTLKGEEATITLEDERNVYRTASLAEGASWNRNIEEERYAPSDEEARDTFDYVGRPESRMGTGHLSGSRQSPWNDLHSHPMSEITEDNESLPSIQINDEEIEKEMESKEEMSFLEKLVATKRLENEEAGLEVEVKEEEEPQTESVWSRWFGSSEKRVAEDEFTPADASTPNRQSDAQTRMIYDMSSDSGYQDQTTLEESDKSMSGLTLDPVLVDQLSSAGQGCISLLPPRSPRPQTEQLSPEKDRNDAEQPKQSQETLDVDRYLKKYKRTCGAEDAKLGIQREKTPERAPESSEGEGNYRSDGEGDKNSEYPAPGRYEASEELRVSSARAGRSPQRHSSPRARDARSRTPGSEVNAIGRPLNNDMADLRRDADFISSLSPSNASALQQRIAQLENQVKDLTEANSHAVHSAEDSARLLDSIRGENQKLRHTAANVDAVRGTVIQIESKLDQLVQNGLSGQELSQLQTSLETLKGDLSQRQRSDKAGTLSTSYGSDRGSYKESLQARSTSRDKLAKDAPPSSRRCAPIRSQFLAQCATKLRGDFRTPVDRRVYGSYGKYDQYFDDFKAGYLDRRAPDGGYSNQSYVGGLGDPDYYRYYKDTGRTSGYHTLPRATGGHPSPYSRYDPDADYEIREYERELKNYESQMRLLEADLNKTDDLLEADLDQIDDVPRPPYLSYDALHTSPRLGRRTPQPQEHRSRAQYTSNATQYPGQYSSQRGVSPLRSSSPASRFRSVSPASRFRSTSPLRSTRGYGHESSQNLAVRVSPDRRGRSPARAPLSGVSPNSRGRSPAGRGLSPSARPSSPRRFPSHNSPMTAGQLSPILLEILKDKQVEASMASSPPVTGGLSKGPYVPRRPGDLGQGSLVKFSRPNGRIDRGVVRYIGPLPGKGEVYLGIECDGEGRHDGSYQGKNYFHCRPNKGVFITFSKVVLSYS